MSENRESDEESSCRSGHYLVQRNLPISGRRTTVRLEDEMWEAFNEVVEREEFTVEDLVGHIHSRKKTGQSFTSAIRVFLMLYYRKAAMRADDARIGHGTVA